MAKKLKATMEPAWVCTDCGTAYGKWYQDGEYFGPSHHCATYHYNTCDVCGTHDVPVTEPRDFGYLCSDWRSVRSGNSKRDHSCSAARL